MSIDLSKKKLNKLLDFYENYLQTVNEDTFLISPKQGGWSFAEIYSHILYVNHVSAIAIENCLNKTAHIKTEKPGWRVRLIFFLGMLPPVKIKAPTGVAEKSKKISKEEASNQLITFRKKMELLYPQFKRFDANYKIKHPRLGYLDAKDWLRFAVVHTKHHVKQISRLEKSFSGE